MTGRSTTSFQDDSRTRTSWALGTFRGAQEWPNGLLRRTGKSIGRVLAFCQLWYYCMTCGWPLPVTLHYYSRLFKCWQSVTPVCLCTPSILIKWGPTFPKVRISRKPIKRMLSTNHHHCQLLNIRPVVMTRPLSTCVPGMVKNAIIRPFVAIVYWSKRGQIYSLIVGTIFPSFPSKWHPSPLRVQLRVSSASHETSTSSQMMLRDLED